MLTYIARRFLYSIPVLFLSSFLSFVFVSLSGDPASQIRQNPNFSVVTLHHLQHRYHLDQPIVVRYWYWLEDVFTHKLGTSLNTLQPVWPDITRTLGHTTQLIVISESLALVIGIGVGVYSAVRQYSFFDYVTTSLSFLRNSESGFRSSPASPCPSVNIQIGLHSGLHRQSQYCSFISSRNRSRVQGDPWFGGAIAMK